LIRHNIHKQCVFLAYCSLFALIFASAPRVALGQTKVPLEGQSGVIEKSLEQSRPFKPVPEPKRSIENRKARKIEKDSKSGPLIFVKKIKLTGNTVFSDEILLPIFDLGEGKDVTLSTLTIFADKVSAFYANQGYLLATAFIPKQEVKDGIVEMVITEGRINKVIVQGNKKLSEEKFKKRMKMVQEESILREQTLERVLLELNELMGVKVKAVLKPGELPGTSDLVMDVTELRPYNVSFDFDNFGSRFTGAFRSGFNMAYANIFTLGDQFSARWTRTSLQDAYSPFYTFPVNSYGTRMKVAYTFTENELGDSLKNLAAGGSSTTVGLEVSHLFYKSLTASFSARTGIDFKSAENESQGSNTNKDNLTNVSLGLGGNFSDSYLGRTFYDLKFQMGLREGDPNRALASRAGGHGEIFSTNIDITRLQSAKLLNSYFILKFKGQINNDRALAPFLFIVGGVGTVRGYPLSAYSGDMGFNVSAEYTVPFPWDIKWHNDFPKLNQIVSFISFLEHGHVYVREKQSGEIDQHITGAGAGLKIQIPKKTENSPNISFALTYGLPVFNSIAPDDGSHGTIYLNGMINY